MVVRAGVAGAKGVRGKKSFCRKYHGICTQKFVISAKIVAGIKSLVMGDVCGIKVTKKKPIS